MDGFQYLLYEQELYDLAEELCKKGTIGQSGKGKRNITDVAISKIPYIGYPELDINQSLIVHELGEFLLQEAKNKNNSNEVMITYDFDNNLSIKDGIEGILEKTGVCYGTINETVPFSDTKTMSIFNRAKNVAILSMHNHPCCSTFSA